MEYSVIITYCCNRKKELCELLESIFNQTVVPNEVIVVSDGNAKELYNIKFDIILIEANEIGRPGPLRNEGIKLSKHRYVFITDDDDIWHPQKAEFQLISIQNKNAGACFTEKLSFTNNNYVDNIKRYDYVESNIVKLSHLLIQNNLPLSSCLIDKSLVNFTFSHSEDVRGWADYDLWLRIIKTCKIIKIKSPLLFYRSHSGSMRNGYVLEMIDSQKKRLLTSYGLSFSSKLIVIVVYLFRRIKWKYSSNEY